MVSEALSLHRYVSKGVTCVVSFLEFKSSEKYLSKPGDIIRE